MKTKPIGVRFDEDLLNKVKTSGLAESPQKALNLYEKSYVELVDLKSRPFAEPEEKKEVQENKPNLNVMGFVALLDLAKGGASRQEVEAGISANKKLTAGQIDSIRSKIKQP